VEPFDRKSSRDRFSSSPTRAKNYRELENNFTTTKNAGGSNSDTSVARQSPQLNRFLTTGNGCDAIIWKEGVLPRRSLRPWMPSGRSPRLLGDPADKGRGRAAAWLWVMSSRQTTNYRPDLQSCRCRLQDHHILAGYESLRSQTRSVSTNVYPEKKSVFMRPRRSRCPFPRMRLPTLPAYGTSWIRIFYQRGRRSCFFAGSTQRAYDLHNQKEQVRLKPSERLKEQATAKAIFCTAAC